MEFDGEREIAATRQEVFDALNDPEVLSRSIPGCEDFQKLSDTEMEATIVNKIGPVTAKFKCKIALSDIVAPESYTLSGEGSGGGSIAKGSAKVSLDDLGEKTMLHYTFNADISGKLAQLGSRLIEGSVAKLTDDFFNVFSANVTGADVSKLQTSNVLQNASRTVWVILGLIAVGIAAWLLL